MTSTRIAPKCPTLVSAAFLTAACANGASLAQSDWTQTDGPTGGFVLKLAFQDNQGFAAALGGGVFRTTDGGINWSPASDGLPALLVSTSIALADSGAFALVGSDLFRFDAVAQRWLDFAQPLPPGDSSLFVHDGVLMAVVNPTGTAPSLLFALNEPTGRLSPLTLPVGDAFTFTSQGGALLAIADGFTTHRSVDGGMSWEPIEPLSAFDLVSFFGGDEGVVLVRGAFSGATSRSFDGGATWEQIEPLGLPPGSLFNFQIESVNGTLLLILPTQPVPEILASHDAGETWSTASGAGLPDPLYSVTDAASSGSELIISTGLGLWRSGDEGESFTDSNDGLVATRIASVGAVGDSLLAALTNGPAAFRSDDQGQTWDTLAGGIGLANVISWFSLDDSTVFAGTSDLGVFRSTDGGLMWMAVSNGLPVYGSMSGAAIQPINDFARIGDAIFVATGGGSQFIGGDPHCGCTSTTSGDGVYRTTNLGATWQRVSTGLPINMFHLGEPILRPIVAIEAAGNAVLAATPSHGVFRSVNQGASWSAVPGLTGGQSFASLDDSVFLLAPGGAMLESINQGMTWLPAPSDTPAGFEEFSEIVAHEGAIFLAGGDGLAQSPGVFRTSDGGATWQSAGSALDDITVMALASTPFGLAAGTNGSGVWLLGPDAVAADINQDGVVDGIDLGILLANWSIPAGSAGCGGASPCAADLNADGVVDGLDLGVLLASWTM